VLVALECGLENKLRSVAENGKCNYEMIFETMAACDPKIAKAKEVILHDEL
jgi:hypothetical protein